MKTIDAELIKKGFQMINYWSDNAKEYIISDKRFVKIGTTFDNYQVYNCARIAASRANFLINYVDGLIG